MAKVSLFLPDDLLRRIDAKALRQGTTRDALLRDAARRELGDPVVSKVEIKVRLHRVAAGWPQGVDIVSELRADRRRVVGR